MERLLEAEDFPAFAAALQQLWAGLYAADAAGCGPGPDPRLPSHSPASGPASGTSEWMPRPASQRSAGGRAQPGWLRVRGARMRSRSPATEDKPAGSEPAAAAPLPLPQRPEPDACDAAALPPPQPAEGAARAEAAAFDALLEAESPWPPDPEDLPLDLAIVHSAPYGTPLLLLRLAASRGSDAAGDDAAAQIAARAASCGGTGASAPYDLLTPWEHPVTSEVLLIGTCISLT